MEIHGDVEIDQEGQVFGGQNVAQEGCADFLLHGQHTGLAAAGIDQQAQRERLVGLRCEILDCLRLAVFTDLEIFFFQIRNQGSALVFDVEVEVDYLYVDFEGGDGLVLCGGLVLELGPSGSESPLSSGALEALGGSLGGRCAWAALHDIKHSTMSRDGGYSVIALG